MQVLVLIANPAEPALDDRTAKRVAEAVGGSFDWLAPRLACEIANPKSSEPERDAREALAGLPVDVALLPETKRRTRLLVADMDSTMINEESIDELGAALGIKDKIAAITEQAMRGELDFEGALTTRVALLKGLDLKTIDEIRRERITLAPGGRALVQTMREYGAHCALVSGGFTLFAEYYGKRIGFETVKANELRIVDGRLTGEVEQPIVGRAAKLDLLKSLTAGLGLSAMETLAVGDGANDLDMIRAAGLGVAMHAKPIVAAEARVRIEHGDLTALLYLQGYRQDEFVL